MNFPPFWAKGGCGDFFCWRWSSRSVAEAQLLANQAAERLAERIRSGARPPQFGGYYPDRPFREQVLMEIKSDTEEVIAVITRNSYGCLVLNTSRVMFVDVDLPEPGPPKGLFQRLFGTAGAAAGNQQSAAILRVENWTRQHPEWGWRIYRTRAGLRLLATHGLLEPDSATADSVFEALGADPLYRKLCQAQKCYRARLTPKPWRCGVRRRPERWPWLDARQERQFQKWEAQYQSYSANWATCEFIRPIGNSTVHPEVQEVQTIVKLHDGQSRVESKLRLA